MDGPGGPSLSANDQLRVNLRALMRWRKMTQAELADQLGVSQPWVSKRMSGVTPFQIEDLDAIGAVFGLSPMELLQPGTGAWDRRHGTERRIGLERRRNRPIIPDPPDEDDDPRPPLGSHRYHR